MEIRLDGRSALITGGSKGLGLAMAERFAASGADVVILARNAEGLRAAESRITTKIIATAAERSVVPKVLAISCDVARAEDIQRAWSEAMKAFGKVDILVNNAGTSQRGPFEEISDATWQADLDLKLFAAIRLCRLALPGMKERRWGRIVNILNSGAKAPRAGGAPTAVSRAAGLALTKVLAGEGAPHNVLVNALMIGVIVTDQIARQHARERKHASLEELIRARGAEVPLGRMGEAEELANVACFLASDAGSYVTGTAINVDGGMSPVP
jgi:3-oxoacyl-[acyl-carrier protein] reductase